MITFRLFLLTLAGFLVSIQMNSALNAHRGDCKDLCKKEYKEECLEVATEKECKEILKQCLKKCEEKNKISFRPLTNRAL